MTTDFMKEIESILNNMAETENGALGYKSTGTKLVDLNFRVPSLRGTDPEEIIRMWEEAYTETPEMAILWIFYIGDVRGGMGERRLFRILMNHITHQRHMYEFIKHIPTYNRWDSVIDLLDVWPTTDVAPVLDEEDKTNEEAINLIKQQITKDAALYKSKNPISLLAKWMPSINTSSEKTKRMAKRLAKELGVSPKVYRKLLSTFRRYIDVTEVKMSANNWEEINYSKVPSVANTKYANAFEKHDPERRKQYLEDVAAGKKTINSTVAFPHQILNTSFCNPETAQVMWDSLPNSAKDDANILVVRDGSGSMRRPIPGSNITANVVADALTLYFAERLEGPCHNRFITFSSHPEIVTVPDDLSLAEKVEYLEKYGDCTNTNIAKVFNLILGLAKLGGFSQEDLPDVILIISDMEFDGLDYNWDRTLFENISNSFKSIGLKLPRLVFWNVNSRSNCIPMQQNELGLTLVSGFSINGFNMIKSKEINPAKVLEQILVSDRYLPIINEFSDCIKYVFLDLNLKYNAK